MRRIATALAILIFALRAEAQVTIQQGRTLSELIENLYGGNGIQLKANGHQAHFGESEDFQQFSQTLQKILQARPVFPVPSAVGAISYKFNEDTGTYEKVQGPSGPIISERATTSGRGNASFAVSYTFSDFEKINGSDNIDLTLHHCLLPECVGANPLSSPYLHDVIKIGVHLKLKSQVIATSIVFGLTDRVDVGLVIPYIRNDLTVFTHAVVVPDPATPPGLHSFDPSVETPDQLAFGHAIGIGDIVARGKYQFATRLPVQTAALVDLTLPSGQKENFFGTGDFRVKGTLIASKTGARFSPHLNVGYEHDVNDARLSSFDYRAGSEVLISPRLTVTGDLVGTDQPRASSEFQARALEGQSLVPKSQIDGALGGKYQVGKNGLWTFNILVPLNSAGIRPNSVISTGMQFGF